MNAFELENTTFEQGDKGNEADKFIRFMENEEITSVPSECKGNKTWEAFVNLNGVLGKAISELESDEKIRKYINDSGERFSEQN